MKIRKLRRLLKNTDDKLSIFSNREILNKYDINIKEFLGLICEFLTDEERLKLFDFQYIEENSISLKIGIINSISNENVIFKIINNTNIMNGLDDFQIFDSIKKLSDEKKVEILLNRNFVKNGLNLRDEQIVNLVKELSSEDVKNNIIEIYEFKNYLKTGIIDTFSEESKLKKILTEKDLSKNNIIKLLSKVDTKKISEFLINNKEFCNEKNLEPYEVIMVLNNEKQKEFVENIENIDLSLDEKRKILIVLDDTVKQDINYTNFREEYKTAISMKCTKNIDQVILNVDLEENLEIYRGLDNFITINPESFNKDKRDKFIKLCDICPNLKVINELYSSNPISTSKEYKEAEEWIDGIIDNLDSKYSKAQKLAIIDNEIGKKISYSPDFDTEIFDISDCRALWKIISSGYGVCNGIAKVEQYILNKIGIESEIVAGESHAFLKIKNIELPLSNDEIVKGNTIVDPTWNLASNRFGGCPDNFCVSYEQIRKNDIDKDAKDHNCHKNDEKLQDATLGLDKQSLRKLFTSVGIADKDGIFPIDELIKKSKLVDEIYASRPDQNISKQLLLFSKTYPEFAACQNSSMKVLSDIFLNNENLKFNRCVVNRVYEKEDESKQPILFVYVDLNEFGEKFYFASKDEKMFIKLSKEEFEKKFECYNEDIKRHNMLKLWEINDKEKEDIDLSKGTSKIIAKEGEGR